MRIESNIRETEIFERLIREQKKKPIQNSAFAINQGSVKL